MSDTDTVTCFMALGANLGDREHNLREALRRLQDVMIVRAISAVYLTPPWGPVEQPDYYNACVEGETKLSPAALLAAAKSIERDMGRESGVRYGPRVIDIDLLFYGATVLNEPGLKIPHPRIAERAFVLVPLADIAPDLKHPELGESVRTLLTRLDASDIRRLELDLSLEEATDD